MNVRILATASAVLAATACAAPKRYYVMAPGTPSARLRVMGSFKEVTLFTDGGTYELKVPPDGSYVDIPATGLIGVARYLFFQGSSVHYSCYPTVRFVPSAGATYVLDIEQVKDKCVAELARESPGTRTGLAELNAARPPMGLGLPPLRLGK